MKVVPSFRSLWKSHETPEALGLGIRCLFISPCTVFKNKNKKKTIYWVTQKMLHDIHRMLRIKPVSVASPMDIRWFS